MQSPLDVPRIQSVGDHIRFPDNDAFQKAPVTQFLFLGSQETGLAEFVSVFFKGVRKIKSCEGHSFSRAAALVIQGRELEELNLLCCGIYGFPAHPFLALLGGEGKVDGVGKRRIDRFELVPADGHQAQLIFYLGHSWDASDDLQHATLIFFRGRVAGSLNKPLLGDIYVKLGITETILKQGCLDPFHQGHPFHGFQRFQAAFLESI